MGSQVPVRHGCHRPERRSGAGPVVTGPPVVGVRGGGRDVLRRWPPAGAYLPAR